MTSVRQRTKNDCGCASLGILLADLAARRVDPKMRGLNALYSRELVAAAKTLGVHMRQVRKFDLDRDEGILRIRWNSGSRKKDSPDGHFVALIAGAVHCPGDAVVRPWREYMVEFDARPCTLLRVA
jgi:hypothetical protein